MRPYDALVSAIEKVMRDNIKVDATGLSPAIASAYVVGFDEAAKAVAKIIARQAEAELREALKPFAAVAAVYDGTGLASLPATSAAPAHSSEVKMQITDEMVESAQIAADAMNVMVPDKAMRAALTAALSTKQAVEPVAWMDDGSCRAGSDWTARRVVTDEQKRGMPSAIASSFATPLYTSTPLPHRGGGSASVTDEF